MSVPVWERIDVGRIKLGLGVEGDYTTVEEHFERRSLNQVLLLVRPALVSIRAAVQLICRNDTSVLAAMHKLLLGGVCFTFPAGKAATSMSGCRDQNSATR